MTDLDTTARAIVDDLWWQVGTAEEKTLIERITQALAAEREAQRERDAKVADRYAIIRQVTPLSDIAAAIRAGRG